MSRSGYVDADDLTAGELNFWRANVARAINGQRGQAFLRELLTSLDELPEKRLIGESLKETSGAVCSLGAVGRHRKLAMDQIDPEAYWEVAKSFNMAQILAQEIMYLNDEGGPATETPETRFLRMREWVVKNLKG